MARFVPDASATVAWCLDDEKYPWAERLLDRLQAGDEALVPRHWEIEVANAFVMAIRRGRLSLDAVLRVSKDLFGLPIVIDNSQRPATFDRVCEIAHRYGLTAYDAAYLELAFRENLPLATMDKRLRSAAHSAGVLLVAEP